MYADAQSYPTIPEAVTPLAACAAWAEAFVASPDDAAVDEEALRAPERFAAAVAAAHRGADEGVEAAVARQPALRLMARPVELKSAAADDERWLLPQLSGLVAALRGGAGCVLVATATDALCVGLARRPVADEDAEDDGAEAPLRSVCFDPRPRPALAQRTPAALHFTSAKALQLHVLALLTAETDDRRATLGVVVSGARRDASRLALLERDAAAIRRAEKKRAIERQRAEIEQLRRALRPAAQAAATRSGDGEQFVAFGERLYAELRGAALDAGAASPLEAATRAYEAAAARPLTGAAARLLASADGDDFLRAGAALYAAARAAAAPSASSSFAASSASFATTAASVADAPPEPPFATSASFAPPEPVPAAAPPPPVEDDAADRRSTAATDGGSEAPGGDDAPPPLRLDADEGDDRLDVPTPFRGGATPLSEAADATGGDDDDVLLQSAAPPRAAAASPEGLVVDVGAADRRPLVASYGSDSEDGAAAEPPPRVPPAGWAAEYDMGAAARQEPARPAPPAARRRSGGDVVEVDLFDDAAPDAAARKQRMERFQQMREKRARAMDESRPASCHRAFFSRRLGHRSTRLYDVVAVAPPARPSPGAWFFTGRKHRRRRLEKEHHAALRAGGFAHNADASKPTPSKRAGPPPVGRGRLCNAKTLANALQQICLAGPHCADRLAAALASLKASPADHHVVVLKDDGVRTFRGVYAVGRGGACEKIHGRGPARFAEADVATFLKFNSARRAFVKLPSRSFSLTTDAVMLSASVLPKNKPVLY